MSRITVIGAGAFGTALALTYARAGRPVTLVARDAAAAQALATSRRSGPRLPGFDLPPKLVVTDRVPQNAPDDIVLLALPTQSLPDYLSAHGDTLGAAALVACCKGIVKATGLGPVQTLTAFRPQGTSAILTGPSFAADIAAGAPTALVVATGDETAGRTLQEALSTPTLRIYRATDVTGAELGGALKNVIALAAGIAIGAGLGDSARAALIARGFAEMGRFAAARGARTETLAGLSGLGDLVLTCTSEKSRNFRAGMALGRGDRPDPNATVEGMATALALDGIAAGAGIDLPITAVVAAILRGETGVPGAIDRLMARPLTTETP